jgi:eukaryotic-like serine/threonine-protein kinase
MLSRAPGTGSLDRYVVLEYLAEGGMGAIFIGKKLGAGGFEKPVVLKQLLPEFTSNPEFIELFLREARLSATLDHANIIHTIDLVTAGDEHFMVMEYLAGADLRTLLQKAKRRHQRLSPAAAIFITRELLSALAYAHAKVGPEGKPLELIHRDVSPSNILISHNGEVKLTDFGIAKAATHNSGFYRVKGKVGYMSPEQARAIEIDHRSDLYALAVCFYEMLTGERLFVHVGLSVHPDELYSQPIPTVSDKVEGLPPALDQVLSKALAVDPAARFQSAGELQEALLRCAHQAGLMMSATELAAHLLEVCGDPARWRDLDEPLPEESTEIFGDEGTEQLDADEVVGAPMAEGAGQEGDVDGRQARRVLAPVTQLGRLKGMELTSMFKLSEVAPRGSTPLVDLDDPAEDPSAIETLGFRPSQIDLSNITYPPAAVARGLAAPPEPMMPAPAPLAAGASPLPAPLPRMEGDRDTRPRRSWGIWVVIVLLGIGAAIAVGLSGPGL